MDIMNCIEVQNLVKTFREKGKTITAVDDISFSVRKGEIFGLLGPNGAGKSTTINILTGLLDKDSGKVKILWFDPKKLGVCQKQDQCCHSLLMAFRCSYNKAKPEGLRQNIRC